MPQTLPTSSRRQQSVSSLDWSSRPPSCACWANGFPRSSACLIAAASLFLLGLIGDVASVIDPFNPIRVTEPLGIISERVRTAGHPRVAPRARRLADHHLGPDVHQPAGPARLPGPHLRDAERAAQRRRDHAASYASARWPRSSGPRPSCWSRRWCCWRSDTRSSTTASATPGGSSPRPGGSGHLLARTRRPHRRHDDDSGLGWTLASQLARTPRRAPSPVSFRMTGATFVPSSSIERITASCGIVPTLRCSRKRSYLNSSYSYSIFSITSCGLPTSSEPRGARNASNCSRVIGDQPRSRPIFVITCAYGGQNVSTASCESSAMNPCELIATGSCDRIVPRPAGGLAIEFDQRREPLGLPPIIASTNGNPNSPARITEPGLPPTAIQTGSGSCTGRG